MRLYVFYSATVRFDIQFLQRYSVFRQFGFWSVRSIVPHHIRRMASSDSSVFLKNKKLFLLFKSERAINTLLNRLLAVKFYHFIIRRRPVIKMLLSNKMWV